MNTKPPIEGKLETTDPDGYYVGDKTYSGDVKYLTAFIGIGFSVNFRNRSVGALDYRYQQWSYLTSNSSSVTFTDTHKLSGGMSILPRLYGRKWAQRLKYQVGGTLSSSYLKLQGKTPLNYSVTAGAVFPLSYSNTMNVGLEYGRTGLRTTGKIQEQYLKLTVGFNFGERAFFRQKFD